MQNKTKIFLGLLILIAGAVGLVFLFSGPKNSENKEEEKRNEGFVFPFQQNREEDQPRNCKNDPNPVFTHPFTDIEKIEQLAPLGSINAGSPGRAYVFIKGKYNEPHQKVPIYAPTDATLEYIVYARRDPNNPTARGEYRLDFRVSCEVRFTFDHISDISDKLMAYAPSEPANNTASNKSISVPVKAGEKLGETDGAMRNGSWDFILINESKNVSHINPKRWDWEQTTHADCPYDYFTPELKSAYYAKLRAIGGEELNPLNCGSPSHDIAGTASGGWFQKDSTNMKGMWMEIGNATKKSEINIRKDGRNFFSVRNYKTRPFPDQLTVGKSACYVEENKWAFIKVDSDSQLSLATGSGNCPNAFPSYKTELWER